MLGYAQTLLTPRACAAFRGVPGEHPSFPDLRAPRTPVAPTIRCVIIVDYSDLIENTANAYGRSWAITRRCAVALDNGCLIFRDTSTLDPEH